ncbi:ABC transporter [candidate division TA06 bacterium DG_24]|uniref:ABC transporter n=3 Tax=Bacteria division TA06 TaxID=1156500 RepID=A0A0S8JP18_UNCT6|nr:MAG: ABC transporter [candidate division TA06 bacterium DG_24]KPK69432.1 MAG: ABC transporter [candidate division TA06 bacterium SM23_40]KPL11400.1 MAG: ABC transporter [candidate division TA06 bacterium SM1_40]
MFYKTPSGGPGERRFPMRRAGRRKVFALRDVGFSVPRGEIFGIVGPNGSGKSTLVRIISTLLYPDQGSVSVFGYDVQKEARQVRRLINRVSVDASFFKRLSAWENLRYASRLYGLPPKEGREATLRIMERLGFKRERMSDPLEDLSRGMQQKVAIARALMTSPVLLLLDEPTTGLDPKSKREVQRFILETRDEHDATILLTTHDMDEADRVCNRVAIIDGGRFVAVDTPEGLKRAIGSGDGGTTLEDVFLELTGKGWGDEDE